LNELFFHDHTYLPLSKTTCNRPSLRCPSGPDTAFHWLNILVKSLAVFLAKVPKISRFLERNQEESKKNEVSVTCDIPSFGML